jgi:hypothetical protein
VATQVNTAITTTTNANTNPTTNTTITTTNHGTRGCSQHSIEVLMSRTANETPINAQSMLKS